LWFAKGMLSNIRSTTIDIGEDYPATFGFIVTALEI
jgi:hypothetical protein